MTLNPFTIIDGILADYASPRVRRVIHSLILLAASVVTIYLAADGDWTEFFIALGATIYAAANKANTDPYGAPFNDPVFYDGAEEHDGAADEVSGNDHPELDYPA